MLPSAPDRFSPACSGALGLSDCNWRAHSIHFYLLERLSNISIFSIIPDLENFRDELLKMLVQAAYDIAGDITAHQATSKVTDHLTSIICSVIEDMALLGGGLQVDLLDLMVCALCQDEKKKNHGGYTMMRKVIASCHNNFQPFLERQLHQVTLLSWFLSTSCNFSARCLHYRFSPVTLCSLLAPATRRMKEEACLGAQLRRAWANGGEGFLVAARASTDAVARH